VRENTAEFLLQYLAVMNMNWNIEYFDSSLEQTIFSLPKGLLSRYLHITNLIQEFGANLGMPYTRAMGEGLFEIRIKSREGNVRIFYCTLVGKQIVMLHVFIKKSQKTPKRELEIARKRLKEVKKRDT